MEKELTDEIFLYEYLEYNKTLVEICEEYTKSIGSLNKKLVRLKLKKSEEQKYFSKFINHTNLRERGLYRENEIKDYLAKRYLEDNVRTSDLASELETSKISLERFFKKYNIRKDRNQYQKLIEETNFNLYGFKSVLQDKDVKNKIKKTNLDRYGVDNPFKDTNIQKRIQITNIERYGSTCSAQNKEIQEKIKQDNIIKYGVKHNIERDYVREKIRKTNIEKIGFKTPFESSVIQSKVDFNKIYETKKIRGTFNTSNPEEWLFLILTDLYKGHEIVRQYRSDLRYPFLCDFYIPDFDFFIELQGNWTHGKVPFNGSNLPENWLKKSKKSKYYQNAIEVYTVRDPLKRKYAIEYNLNYLEIWNSDLKKGLEGVCSLILNKAPL